MSIERQDGLARVQDRRGIALPIALLGLVAISLLVTTALLTSTTENAISNAQRSGSVSAYEAEGALQSFLSTQGSTLAAGTYSHTPSGSSKAYAMTVSRLALRTPPTGSSEGHALYSIQSEWAQGGRSFIAMARVPVRFLNMNINAGATLGSNATIGGSIDINSSSNLCTLAGADDAVVHANGTTLTINGQAANNIGNDTSTYAGDRAALTQHVLNGMSIYDLAKNAHIKFRQASPVADSVFGGRPSSDMSRTNPATAKYNWGCPNRLASCTGRDTTYYPLVAIDATTASGGRGEVSIQGDHGQGMLLIVNGDLRITGNFLYKGIILVDGETDIHGGGGGSNSAKIEGALLGLGDVNICQNTSDSQCANSTGTDGDNTTQISSGAVIQYNRCAVNSVQSYINNQPIQQAPTRPTFAWYELVR
jgi:hypothetical protein